MYRILLIEDDYTLTEEIKRHLISYGYEVSMIQDFHNNLHSAAKASAQIEMKECWQAAI